MRVHVDAVVADDDLLGWVLYRVNLGPVADAAAAAEAGVERAGIWRDFVVVRQGRSAEVAPSSTLP
ncbi:MAG: hypothetical protein N2512_13030 [Armatimonadetes bacterium]|nr:hypothetical protein [Armatimonadota bacterium]